MDTLLSQLKGQGSPFSSLPPKHNNVEKLLDTIHLLSQATVLVAHQLQEQNTPVKAKPYRETQLPTPPLTTKSSPAPSAKKTPPTKLSTPVLSWVPRAPEYYRLPPLNPTSTSTSAVVPAKPTSLTPAKPTPHTPHTKKDRKPKSKRTPTQPTPTPAAPRTVLTDQRGPLAPTNSTPSPTLITGQAQPDPDQREPLTPSTPRPAQSDRREPLNPLPTPTPSTPSTQPDTTPPTLDADARMAAKKAATKAKRKLAKQERRESALAALAASTPTPPPTHQDDVAPMAPSNDVVNFPHSYDDCPRLPECPAHEAKFAVSCQAYAERKRNAPLPPLYPQPRPYAGSEEFELRCERDTRWWPEIPSTRSSSPGSPADPQAFTPPNDGFLYL